MTGLGSNGSVDTVSANGGFNIANSIAIGLVAVFTVCVLVALCYSIYYHQAKLKLRKADLERLDRPEMPEIQLAGINPEAIVTPTSHNTITAEPPECAITMPPSASPPLQRTGEELKSPTTAETKMKAVVLEDKSLGCYKDIRPILHTFDESSMEGQLFAFRSSRT